MLLEFVLYDARIFTLNDDTWVRRSNV